MNRTAWLVAALLFAIAVVVLVRPTNMLAPAPTSLPPSPSSSGG